MIPGSWADMELHETSNIWNNERELLLVYNKYSFNLFYSYIVFCSFIQIHLFNSDLNEDLHT